MSQTTASGTYKKNRIWYISEVIHYGVLASFVIPTVFLIYRIGVHGFAEMSAETGRAQRDYILMITQCVLGIGALYIPALLSKCVMLNIHTALKLVFSIFLFCAIFLGEVANFYYLVPHWDDFLHFSSSVMTGLFGCVLATRLNRSQQTKTSLSPALVAVFAFCFAVCAGVVWEIYEFGMDGLLGLNMQKASLENGEVLSGHMAVADTMQDIIVCVCGAFTASLIGYSSIKHKKGCGDIPMHSYSTEEQSREGTENRAA